MKYKRFEFNGFDWDAANRAKISERVPAVNVEWALTHVLVFREDERHSWDERRLMAVGSDPRGRYLLVVFTMRFRDAGAFMRPISARYMHEKEAKQYEKEFKEEYE